MSYLLADIKVINIVLSLYGRNLIYGFLIVFNNVMSYIQGYKFFFKGGFLELCYSVLNVCVCVNLYIFFLEVSMDNIFFEY